MKKFFLIAFFVFFVDQITKTLIRFNLLYGEEKKITSFFSVVHWKNRGGLWGFLSDSEGLINTLLFLVIPILGLIFLFYLFIKSKSLLEKVLLSIIVGGAFGNLFDRIFFGEVTDFLFFYLPDRSFSWPAFNFADASISVSLAFYFIYLIFLEKKDAPDTY